jgi:hypothetical protein
MFPYTASSRKFAVKYASLAIIGCEFLCVVIVSLQHESAPVTIQKLSLSDLDGQKFET